MQFAELCLNDKYSLMFDNLNSFPFGMGISLLDEDGEEINKYIYDLRGNPLDEVREALNKFHIGNDPWGGIRLSESEIARVSKFIIMQAQQCEEEWLRTFEMEI